MTNFPDVRVAISADEESVMYLLRMAHDEGGQHVMNEDKVRNMVRTCSNRSGGLIGVIGDPGGKLRGCIVMTIAPIWYSDEFQLMELVAFVHPACRNRRYDRQLIAFAKWCSEQMTMDLTIGILTNVRTEAKVRLYERQLPKSGAFFVYRPNNGGQI
jgi:hypothetical protein